ncbi:MAG: polysaccharide deacetylase family protein [Nocardioidaceae bacterium]|nr:polysaccharide deacetylase family protein [Nocardioidaceae bacterium]
MSTTPREHDRYDYSAIVDRPRLTWPGGARVAVWVVPNVEHFLFDRPSTANTAFTMGLSPDVLNYSWRDYGARVGFFRMAEVLERHGFPATVALNSDACERYPRIIEEGRRLGWEWMGHGTTNSLLVDYEDEDEERAFVEEVLSTIGEATGTRPRGWLSPALSETNRTLDLLAEAGVDYTGNWVNDEQPYEMRVTSGRMLALPYSQEINDIPAMLEHKKSGEQFGQMIRDTFDVLYEDGARSGRVMAICVHPFLIGHPHRSKYFEQALAHIAAHDEVWLATGSQIADHYRAQVAQTETP